MENKSFKGRKRVLIVCGGTGGHIYPAISTAKTLIEKAPYVDILFVTTNTNIDNRIFSQKLQNFKRLVIDSPKLPKTISGVFQFVHTLVFAIAKSYAIIKRFSPHVITGYGGYVQVPIMLAAILLGKPFFLHEQNVYPGLSNRIMAVFANRIALSFEASKKFFRISKKIIVTGVPVRSQIYIKKKIEKDENSITLLVLGGSQGAHSVNVHVIKALKLLSVPHLNALKVIHVTGERDYHLISSEYEKIEIQSEVHPFVNSIEKVYTKADLVISRAGAGTLCELSTCRLPSILIPYPYAGGHQYHNARIYEYKGASLIFDQLKNTSYDLAKMIEQCLHERDTLKNMGQQAGSINLDNASDRLVKELVDYLQKK